MATAMAGKKKTKRHASALKAARQAETHRLRNRSAKRAIREAMREAMAAAKAKGAADSQTQTLLRGATALLDKAARRGVIHWKAAARRKSRLLSHVGAKAPAAAASAK
ncbi:MAG: 30S ribosomal protein S20 [Elusimicrobia bacterium]|nr:30S ribosomal protein S20 [Elusimicrobiota bacterium]MDE2313603.1 30S ribosomal protein S20 [Elusimicrobiota bacterium]